LWRKGWLDWDALKVSVALLEEVVEVVRGLAAGSLAYAAGLYVGGLALLLDCNFGEKPGEKVQNSFADFV